MATIVNLGDLAKASNVSGSEKLPISDTEYIDANQIKSFAQSGMVAEVSGKGLSTNDLTNTLKSQIESAEQPLTNVSQTSSSPAVNPNTHKTWVDAMTAIDISSTSFTDWAEGDEVVLQFTSGDTACELSLPDSVVWLNDNPIDVVANSMYLLSIKIIGGTPVAVGGTVNVED